MPFYSHLSYLLLSLLTQLRVTSAASQAPYKDNSPSCGCYYVESADIPAYFVNHRFYDFQNAATSPTEYTIPAPLVNNTQDAGNEETPDQKYLNSSTWNNDWGIQNWGKNATVDAPVMMQNSPANVYIMQTNASDLGTSNSSDTTFLTLRTTRLESFQSSAEVENENKNLMYASLRMRARIVGAPGAVAGFFTFYDDNNESDIEIVTDDNSTTWRLSNQPSVDKDGNVILQSTLEPGNLPAWNDWHEHRIDWLPGMVRWFVDGNFAVQNSYSVPREPSGLVLNMWSDGGVWSGNMTVGDSAELQIQWVQLVFNTSGPRGGPGDGSNKKRAATIAEHSFKKRKSSDCKVVCRVDGVHTPGFPEVAYAAAAHHEVVSRIAWVIIASAGIFSAVLSL